MSEVVAGASAAQQSQEAEYGFPYHYISALPSQGFAQHLVDTWGINYVSTIEFMLGEISRSNPRSIIDIGCGDGRFTREIHRRFGTARVSGVDYSERAIALAQVMNRDRPELRFDARDITSDSFGDAFDVGILMEVYEHIPLELTHAFLAGVRRALRPGGTLLLTVPHANKPLEYKHVQHFTVQTLSRDLAQHFELVEVLPFERRSRFRGLMNRLLCNRYFVLNHRGALAWLYRMHDRYLFRCPDEQACQRIFVRAVARP